MAIEQATSGFDQELDLLTHDHVFLGRDHDTNQRRTLAVVALTAAMMLAEIVAGLLFNSMALTADGFHMATHAGALGAAALAYAFARRHARDPAYTFGTGKVGDLAGFASALVLAIIALGIGAESVLRLFHPAEVAYGEATVIAVVGLGVNIASVLLLSGGLHHHHGHGHGQAHDNARDHGHAHGRSPGEAAHDHHAHGAHDHGEHDHDDDHGHDHAHHHGHDDDHAHHAPAERDNNMRSAVVHVLADALTSVLAIVALLAGRFYGVAWLDPAMGLVGAVVILAWSRSLIRDTSAVLLDRVEPATEKAMRAELATIGSVRVTDLHVWRVGPSALAAIVSVAGDADAGLIRRRLASVPGLAHLTVEVHGRPLAA